MFGIGYLPIPGTMASLITVIIYYLFYNYLNIFFLYFSYSYFILFILLLNKTIKKFFPSSDPKEIVIDEFIGQSIPLLICENNFFINTNSFII